MKLIHTLRQAHYSFGAIKSMLDGLREGRPEQARAAAEKRLQQLALMSERCAAATAALYAYLREHGLGPVAAPADDLDAVTDYYGRQPT